jgi:hypothetical protein
MTYADIEIQIIDSLDDLSAIRDEWNAVQDACEHKHVFLDHRFVTAWWRHAGHGKSMHTLVLRRRGIVEGVVPLTLSCGLEAFPTSEKNARIAEDFQFLPSLRWRRFVPVRRLSFPLSFASANLRGHFILRRTDSEQIAAVLAYCESIRGQWDVLALDGIPEGAEQQQLVCASASRFGLRRGRSRQSRILLQAVLPASMEAFLAGRSHNFRSGLRRAQRQSIERTASLGEFRIREFRGSSIDEGMTKLLDLERQSWKVKKTRKRELYITLTDAYACFHRNVANAFAASDQAQVLVTEIGGQPVNALYSLERQGVIACVLTYQAEEFANRVSIAPLWARFFEIAIERGMRLVDFNGNSSNLARYANGRTSFDRLVFYNTAIYSSLLRATADAATLLARRFSPAEILDIRGD